MKSGTLAARIWLFTSLFLGLGFIGYALYSSDWSLLPFAIPAVFASLVGSLPVLLLLRFGLFIIKKQVQDAHNRIWLLIILLIVGCIPYSFLAAIVGGFSYSSISEPNAIQSTLIALGALLGCAFAATAFNYKKLSLWATDDLALTAHYNTSTLTENPAPFTASYTFTQQQIQTTMDNPNAGTLPAQNSQQKTIIKAGITATLILLMLIPASFIMRLVEERQARQKEVVEEVSSKRASKQTITTPYINLPYTETYQEKGKVIVQHKYLNILANNLQTNDSVTTIERSRSIYNVLLYRSELNLNGDFKIKIPKDIPLENIEWNQARICIGISDFKGIEEKLVMNIDNSTKLDMQPGLPNDDISEKGLSALLPIGAGNIDTPIGFSLKMNIKGSEQLHYIPLSANSRFTIRSNWNSPSFDGNSLPQEHQITATGFTATWGFNEANLPFTTVLNNKGIKDENIAFGVSLLQPTDQYAKTMRSVKYAILFIGLTFAIFFMVELMQNKVVHPVQYVLIGLALIIFYTLLLSIGEFTGFNIAYAIAASATILLVGIYSKSLFNSGKTSFWLSAFLLLLYGFIYVLIQLEDTALLAGSIGLFILLAAAMYFSRRINWNGQRPSTILVP